MALAATVTSVRADCVILLHGLARGEASLFVLEETLEVQGFTVYRPSYPSTSATVEDLAAEVVPLAIDVCGDQPFHIITHSMGGILVRYWFSTHGTPPNLNHVVMLGPPNHGSEVVDTFGDLDAFGWVNGPAGQQLGTGAENLPASLPGVIYSVGVIAGTQSLNPLFSTLLPGPDDGKVSVASTRVAGMADHIVLPVTHTFMMNNPAVIAQVLHYLEHGRFDPQLRVVDLLLEDAEGERGAGD